jgi:hypothetical protein
MSHVEQSASAVHATLSALVRTNAATSPAWADYEALLLDPATSAFFEARLPDAKATALVDSESNPPSKKKRKRNTASEADSDKGVIVCENCGGTVPQISLRVACLDGTTLDVTMPERGLVREVKRAVGQVRLVTIVVGRSVRVIVSLYLRLRVKCASCATWTRA